MDKHVLILFIYGLNFSFRMLLLEYPGEKTLKIFPAFFYRLQMKWWLKYPYYKKPLLPWKILDSAHEINKTDLTNWMSFLPSNLKEEISPDPEALRAKYVKPLISTE